MKKRKILALVLACATVLSLVGCGGNTATTENSETENTVATESESETAVDHDAWESMTFIMDGMEISLPLTLKNYSLNHENPEYGPHKILLVGDEVFLRPTFASQNFSIVDKSGINIVSSFENGCAYSYNNDIFTTLIAKLYYPTLEIEPIDAPIFCIDLVFDWSVARAIGNGEDVDAPIIELPNGIKIGDYVQDGCPEIIEAYGEPDEFVLLTEKVPGGEAYVYNSEDGTKVFAVYTSSNRIVGFQMWVDYTTYDFYTNN